jgi:hypothetical protein
MNMYRYVFFFVLAIVLNYSLCFSQDYSEKLFVKYESSEIEQMKSQNAWDLELLSFFVEEGYYFVDMPEKPIDYITLQRVNPKTGELVSGYNISEKDIEDFNPLNYNCMFDEYKNRYYKVGNTGKLLVVQPAHVLANKIDNKKRIQRNQ